MIAARPLTETEARAHDRRRAFHEKIAAHAAALEAPKGPLAPAAIEPEAAAAVVPMSAREWFWPVEAEAFPKIRKIQEVVGQYYGVPRGDILSARRTKEVILPRHVAIYLSKELTALSLPAIGRHFGQRDHTTALSAVRKITRQVRDNWELAFDIALLTETLTARAA